MSTLGKAPDNVAVFNTVSVPNNNSEPDNVIILAVKLSVFGLLLVYIINTLLSSRFVKSVMIETLLNALLDALTLFPTVINFPEIKIETA